jgi:hypothetical protein
MKSKEERIKYLESMIPKGFDIEKYRSDFNKYARYIANGVYSWVGIYASDTRELFLLGILSLEGIEIEEV